jgi:hypothetical protein
MSGARSKCGLCATPERQRRFISRTAEAYENSRLTPRHRKRGRYRSAGMSASIIKK